MTHGMVEAIRTAMLGEPLKPGAPIDPAEALRKLTHTGFPARHVGAVRSLSWPESSGKKRREIRTAIGRGGQCLLIGNRGVGKTQLACEATLTWYGHGYDQHHGHPKYRRLADLMDRQRRWIADPKMGTTFAQPEPVRVAKTCGLLTLDDCHDRLGTDFEHTTLSSIIDFRYGRRLPTILISNETLAQCVKSLGASVVDRCKEEGGVWVCDWGSMRDRGEA